VSDAELVTRIYGVFDGSDGDATRALYAELETLGAVGTIAVNLFRAQKSSSRAKVYRGGGYRGMAYDRKGWALDNLCTALGEHAAHLGIAWGWGEDEKQEVHKHVLYVDLPTGQVSYHSGSCGYGPRYNGAWDGIVNASTQRILSWIIRLLSVERDGGTPAFADAGDLASA
jgi:hypothetical protein